jgi:hypothetical protein
MNDQYMRLKALPVAKIIIEKSHTLQGFQERKEFVRIKRKKWSLILKFVQYYEFIAVTKSKDVRVKIIIKMANGGDPYFWSIIPFWKLNNLGTKILYNGNPSED